MATIFRPLRAELSGLRASRTGSFLLLLVMLVARLALPGEALAHSALRHSSPAQGDVLSVVPEALRLTFNLPVELALAQLRLVGPNGMEVELASPELAPDSARVMIARILGPLTAGTYAVHWQIVSADGHPVRGEFSFTMAPGAQGLAPESVPAEPRREEPATTAPARLEVTSPLYALVRWLTFLGLLGAIGVSAFRAPVLWLVRRRGDEAGARLSETAARKAAGVGLGAAVLLVLALGLRLFAQAHAVYSAERALSGDALAPLLTETLWGWGWLLQAAGTLFALLGFVLARGGRGSGWGIALLGVLALSLSPALSGHAATAPSVPGLAVLADALHVLGAGGWLGSLLVVVLVGIPVALRMPAEERGPAVRALVNAFSPAALAFAGVVLATGLFASWLHLQNLSALWESGYGRTLLLKLAVLSVVFLTGAYNWLRVRPALGNETAAHRLRRSAALELAAGVLVLAVTAVLVATPPPTEEPRSGEAVAVDR